MFWHNFKYSLVVLCKNKMLLFWTFAFPIILGFLFNLAFKDIEKNEMLDVFDIAVVNNDKINSDAFFKSAIESLAEGDDILFNVRYVSLDEASSLLESKKIVGYILDDDEVKVVVGSSGINETVLRLAVDEIILNKSIFINYIMRDNATKIKDDVIASIYADKEFTKDIAGNNLSYTMIEYYTLIAMSALYGSIISMFITNKKIANMNSVGKRTAISPVSKWKMLLGSFCASYVVQLVGLFILFLFTIFVIKVDYGSNLPCMVLTSLVGSLAGLSLGVFVASVFKVSENSKTGILTAFIMFGCFLSGMMGITMKYVVDTHVPIVNMLNPANMITDAMYSLYYYSGYERFIWDIGSLLIFSLVMFILSFNALRRARYDSI